MGKKKTIKVIDTETAIEAFCRGEIIINDYPTWSNTRTEISSRCMKQYALSYILHIPAKITPDVARGDLLHKIEHGLWVLDEKTGLLVPGYKSFSSCTRCARRDWKFQYAMPDKPPKGSEIEWKSKAQRYGKWYRGEVANLAGMMYSRFLIEEPRLRSELEIKNIVIEGLTKEDRLILMAKLDELRIKETPTGTKIVIRDHKSGGRNYSNEDFLETNTQMTHYAYCLYVALQDSGNEVYNIPELKKFRNISLEDFLENLIIQIHHINDFRRLEEDHNPITKLYECIRTKQDVKELVYTIRSKQRAIKRREFPQNPLRCPACFWKKCCKNFDMESIFCKKSQDLAYQENMALFAISGIAVETSCKPKIKTYRQQKIFRFPRQEPASLL